MDDRVTMFKKDDFGGVKGACASRNIAIKNARGKYITGLDDDDYFLETHIELLVQKWISCAGKIVAIYPDIYQIKGGKLRKRGLKVSRCTYEMLIYGNWIGNQIFTETSHLRAVDGFDEFFPAWQDLECWYRLLKKHNGYAVSLGHRTCVLDAEHSFERISGKYDNVAQSFKMFVDKHKLTNFQSRALSTQLSFYGSERPSLAALACKCLGLPRIFNFRNALVIFYLSLTNN
jgi:glycosyltransferase involved in cell wall biosynthesis